MGQQRSLSQQRMKLFSNYNLRITGKYFSCSKVEVAEILVPTFAVNELKELRPR